MDSLIAAAARALVAGDALGALKRVGLRDDPPALALRGIAMAQLGEHPRARELLRRAARGFGAHEELARARCVVAEAEVALAMRDLRGSPRTLAAASATLGRTPPAPTLHTSDRGAPAALLSRIDGRIRAGLSVGAGAAFKPTDPAPSGAADDERGSRFPTRAACRRRCWRWPSSPRPGVAALAAHDARASGARPRTVGHGARAALAEPVAETRAALDRPRRAVRPRRLRTAAAPSQVERSSPRARW
jgi:hypothetical protein